MPHHRVTHGSCRRGHLEAVANDGALRLATVFPYQRHHMAGGLTDCGGGNLIAQSIANNQLGLVQHFWRQMLVAQLMHVFCESLSQALYLLAGIWMHAHDGFLLSLVGQRALCLGPA